MTTRRIFMTGTLLAAAGKAADEGEFTDRETSIRFIPGEHDDFFVGVRTPVKCDSIKVEVYYTVPFEQSTNHQLLLHQESIAPCAGNNGYGATWSNFTCPRDSVQFVRLTFLKELGRREIKVGSK